MKIDINTLLEIESWLSPHQVAELYKITRQSVYAAFKAKRFKNDEAINTANGILVSPYGAKEVFQNKRKINK